MRVVVRQGFYCIRRKVSWTKLIKDFDKKARTADYNSRHESYQNDTRVPQMGQKEMMLFKQSIRTNFDGLAMS